jgi:hypothetical protein
MKRQLARWQLRRPWLAMFGRRRYALTTRTRCSGFCRSCPDIAQLHGRLSIAGSIETSSFARRHSADHRPLQAHRHPLGAGFRRRRYVARPARGMNPVVIGRNRAMQLANLQETDRLRHNRQVVSGCTVALAVYTELWAHWFQVSGRCMVQYACPDVRGRERQWRPGLLRAAVPPGPVRAYGWRSAAHSVLCSPTAGSSRENRCS